MQRDSPPRRFLCDQMCAKLGKWLRAAGHDTAIVTAPRPDALILLRARRTRRRLLTCDRDFCALDAEGGTVVHLRGDALDGWAMQLRRRGVDWLANPFSRCLLCNSTLDECARPWAAAWAVPADVQRLWRCPRCRRLFWRGSHTAHMEARLRQWQAGS